MGDLTGFVDFLKKDKRIVRVTFLGDGAVGKTTMVSKFLSLYGVSFNTLPEEERTPFINITGWKQQEINVQCFDLAGQRIVDAHPIDLMTRQVLSGLDVIFFVFTLDRFSSFENIDHWLSLVETNIEDDMENIKLILIGNKEDLERKVDRALIDQVMERGIFSEYIETSAISDKGVEDVIRIINQVGIENLGSV